MMNREGIWLTSEGALESSSPGNSSMVQPGWTETSIACTCVSILCVAHAWYCCLTCISMINRWPRWPRTIAWRLSTSLSRALRTRSKEFWELMVSAHIFQTSVSHVLEQNWAQRSGLLKRSPARSEFWKVVAALGELCIYPRSQFPLTRLISSESVVLSFFDCFIIPRAFCRLPHWTNNKS